MNLPVYLAIELLRSQVPIIAPKYLARKPFIPLQGHSKIFFLYYQCNRFEFIHMLCPFLFICMKLSVGNEVYIDYRQPIILLLPKILFLISLKLFYASYISHLFSLAIPLMFCDILLSLP
jgi:hypothetical protein